jgi:ribosomal protein S16
MLSLRFRLIGKKHQKVYELVVQEKRSKLSGRIIAKLGWWNPRLKTGEFRADRIKFYINHGVKVSDTVWNLLVKRGIIFGQKRPIKIKTKTVEESKELSQPVETVEASKAVSSNS